MELQNVQIKYIETGDASSACITHDSKVYVWGSGLNFRLGNGDAKNVNVPSLSAELREKMVTSIIMGSNSTFAIMESKSVFAWGSSKGGKLGFELAAGKNFTLPKEIISLRDHEI